VQTRAQESLRLADIPLQGRRGRCALTVLDAQRTLVAAQDQLVQIQLNRLQAEVGLYGARWWMERDDRAVGVSRRTT
jgi:outer membrane protein TolC